MKTLQVDGGPGEITPDTHIKMSTARFIVMIVAVVTATVTVAAAVIATQYSITSLAKVQAAHEADTNRHLDKDWQITHGRPMGVNDFALYQITQDRKLDEIAADAKAGREMIRQATLPRLRK
jgi:hypothetical protein